MRWHYLWERRPAKAEQFRKSISTTVVAEVWRGRIGTKYIEKKNSNECSRKNGLDTLGFVHSVILYLYLLFI